MITPSPVLSPSYPMLFSYLKPIGVKQNGTRLGKRASSEPSRWNHKKGGETFKGAGVEMKESMG